MLPWRWMGISLISWGKKNQTAKYYTQSSVHISLTFFPVVKLIQIHVVNSNGTEKKKKKKNPQELHYPKVLMTSQPERCLPSVDSCLIRVKAELFI